MYKSFDNIKTTQLTLARHGFFRQWYELTDGQDVYGKLSCAGFWQRNMLAETANATWLFEREGFFSRVVRITTQGELVGKAKLGMFSKAALMMHDGFEADFRCKSVWISSFAWNTTRFGEIVKIKEVPFSFKKAAIVTIDPSAAQISMVPLLCLLGSYLIILRKRQAAAAASV